MGMSLPSTARLNSTARVSPTRTYSRRSIPSSSVSPGINDPSVESGLLNRRLSTRLEGSEGLRLRSAGVGIRSREEPELNKCQ